MTFGLALEFLRGATRILTKFSCFKASRSPSKISCMDLPMKSIHSSFSIGGFCESSHESQPGCSVGVTLLVPSISSLLQRKERKCVDKKQLLAEQGLTFSLTDYLCSVPTFGARISVSALHRLYPSFYYQSLV